MVGVLSMSTRLTGKLSLRLAVSLLAVAARRTCARCVARVNLDDSHAVEARLVGEERAELGERPVVVLGPLTLSNRSPRTNVFKILNRNRSIRVFCLRNKPLGDAMIYVGLIAALLAAHLLEFALGGTSAYPLQGSTSVGIPLALAFYFLPRELFSIAVCGEFSDAEVNSEYVVNVSRCGLWHFADGQQVKGALAMHKVCLTHARLKQALLATTADVGNLLATVHRPDRDNLIVRLPRQNPIVESDCAEPLKSSLFLPIEPIGVRYFSDTTHDKLRGEAEHITSHAIRPLMKGVLPKYLTSPRNLANKVTCLIRRHERALERVRLLFRRQQFDLGYQLHAKQYSIRLSSIES